MLPRAWMCSQSPCWAGKMEAPWAERAPRDATTGWPVLLDKVSSGWELAAAQRLINNLTTGQLGKASKQGGGPRLVFGGGRKQYVP